MTSRLALTNVLTFSGTDVVNPCSHIESISWVQRFTRSELT